MLRENSILLLVYVERQRGERVFYTPMGLSPCLVPVRPHIDYSVLNFECSTIIVVRLETKIA